MDEGILSKEKLETLARSEIPKSLERSLLKAAVKGWPLDALVRAQDQIKLDVERGSLDLEFWRSLGLSPQVAAEIVAETLNDFLGQRSAYPLDFVVPYERLRSSVQKVKEPECLSYEGRPRVVFDLVVHGLQLIDPNNLIFELQGEASVGVPLAHAAGYLEVPNASKDLFEALGAKSSCDGILHFHDPNKEKKIRSLLQIRMRGGRLEESYSYFRYGIATGRVWLIQEFNAYLYLSADFENLPFDDFPVVADFNVGLGGDVVNVELIVESTSPKELFSDGFDAGEFQADTKNASLIPFGYLHDPSHFIDNVVRLAFRVRRNPTNMMLRIGLPLLLMAVLLLAGGWYGGDQMESQVILAVLVAMVALQLTAAQGMPRDARFSLLDRCFVASYMLAVLLFPLSHIWEHWPEWGRKLAVVVCALTYLSLLAKIFYRPWVNRGTEDSRRARFDKAISDILRGAALRDR